jgi:radical SAM superfamily enzyme
MEEYVDYLVSFLERLSPDTVIQRVTADCPKELLAAPGWINNKAGVLAALDKKLQEKDTFQGKLNEQKN